MLSFAVNIIFSSRIIVPLVPPRPPSLSPPHSAPHSMYCHSALSICHLGYSGKLLRGNSGGLALCLYCMGNPLGGVPGCSMTEAIDMVFQNALCPCILKKRVPEASEEVWRLDPCLVRMGLQEPDACRHLQPWQVLHSGRRPWLSMDSGFRVWGRGRAAASGWCFHILICVSVCCIPCLTSQGIGGPGNIN